MTRREQNYLRREGQFILGNGGVRARRYLFEFTLEHGTGALNPKQLDEFLDLSSKRRKPERIQSLASLLLQQAVDPVVTPGMKQIYAFARSHEMLRPGLPCSLSSLFMKEIRAAFAGDRLSKTLAFRFNSWRLTGA